MNGRRSTIRPAGAARLRALALLLVLLSVACTGGKPSDIQKEILARAAEAERRGDPATAAVEYRRLAEGGVVEAMLRLAALYDDGHGVRADPVIATRWYRRAAEAGDPRAMRELGDRLRAGDGVAADPALAARWYALAAEAGDAAAAGRLGRLLIEGAPGVPPEPQRGLALLERAAREGDVDAQLDLVELHETGRGVPRSPFEARRWYAIAASALERRAGTGDPKAADRLARLYAEGKGVAADGVRAADLFRQAAAAGRLGSLVRLARLYRDGAPGLAPDPARAVELFTEAATRGDRTAAYELGRLHLSLAGTRSDAGPKAAGWLQVAARAGEDRAWFWLGELYSDPATEPHDPEQAEDYWRRAGHSGNGKGYFRLGERARDRGDYEDAVFWFELAARGGYARGATFAERYRRRLDAAALARVAERLRARAGG